MIILKDVLAESSAYTISVRKLIGQPIKDICGAVVIDKNGKASFELYRVVLGDDEEMHVTADDDGRVYLIDTSENGQVNFDTETLESLCEESNSIAEDYEF